MISISHPDVLVFHKNYRKEHMILMSPVTALEKHLICITHIYTYADYGHPEHKLQSFRIHICPWLLTLQSYSCLRHILFLLCKKDIWYNNSETPDLKNIAFASVWYLYFC